MSTATLMFNLLAGTVGAVAVWLAVRALCARLAGRGEPSASGPAWTLKSNTSTPAPTF